MDERLVADLELNVDGDYKDLGRILQAIEELGYTSDSLTHPSDEEPHAYILEEVEG